MRKELEVDNLQNKVEQYIKGKITTLTKKKYASKYKLDKSNFE